MWKRWVELLCLGVVVAMASHAVPEWGLRWFLQSAPDGWQEWVIDKVGLGNLGDLLMLGFGLLLALPAARRSGVCVGEIRRHWWRILLVCAVPIALTAVVYPWLPEKPFANERVGLWLISPLAQDLVFVGYLYGRFAEVGAGRIVSRVPVTWALLATAGLFALWHVPNFGTISAGYVCFQMGYVFVGAVFTGMTRVWTGSMLYVTVVHSVVNYLATRAG